MTIGGIREAYYRKKQKKFVHVKKKLYLCGLNVDSYEEMDMCIC